ncbi:MAG TPA: helix-turn-helix transcriptional regulator [Candidatus Limnocylindrales bacterium]|nr:helix-turn-helix transcriptional regulator [Candidatus Limnocylindrales bacterium]
MAGGFALGERLGERLRELRLAQGLSQRGLAEPSYTRSYLSMIEAGKAIPSEKALRHFADRLSLGDTLRTALELAHRARHDGELDRAQLAFEEVAVDARTFALDEWERAALCGQGEVAIQAGELATAARLFHEAADVCREVTSLALCGDPVGAVALGEAAIGEADRGDHAYLARLHAALIMPYTQIGAFGRVSEAAKQALHLSSRLDDRELLGYVHRAVTHAYIEQKRFSDALMHAAEALRLCEELGATNDVGLCHLARASALKDAERLTEAAAELAIAIEIFEHTHARLYAARATAVLAGVLVAQGRTDDAWELTRDLLDNNDPWTDGYLHRVAGMSAPDPVDAERHLRRSADLFKEQGGQIDLVETCREWGRLLTAQGRLVEAVEVYDLGLRGASTVAQA